ncbi:MAG: hypothetical protein WA441_10370 [Methyloceanibacter sp.]
MPIDRLAGIAPAARISRARVVDAGLIVSAGGMVSGMEMGFHLLRRRVAARSRASWSTRPLTTFIKTMWNMPTRER